MDVLSDVLTTVRLHSAIHFCPELSAPWGIEVPAQRDRALFYVLSRGSCYLEVDGLESPVPLVGGDLAMLPHGAAHTLRDRLHTPAIPLEALLREGGMSGAPRAFHHGGGGGKSALVAGISNSRIARQTSSWRRCPRSCTSAPRTGRAFPGWRRR